MDPAPTESPAHAASTPQTSDDGDSESTASESSVDASNHQLQEKVNKAIKSFIEYRTGKSSLERLKAEVLKAMCHSKGLDEQGTREAMATRLTNWVRSGPSCDREPLT